MKRIKHSFARRLTRRIMLVMLITMTAIAWVIYILARSVMVYESVSHYQLLMDLANERMEKVTTAVELATFNNIHELTDSLSKANKMEAVLRDILELNPHMTGLGIGFVADYYPQKGRWYEPYMARRENGELEYKEIGSKDHDYLNMGWYTRALEAGEACWSEPYYDDAGARSLLLTYAMPIRDEQGRVAGIVCADIALEWLKKQLEEIDREDNEKSWVLKSDDKRFASYSFAITREGKYVVHPDQKCVLNENFFESADLTADTVGERVRREMAEGKEGHAELTIDGIRSFIAYAPLEHTNWSMAIVIPRFTIFLPGRVVGCLILLLMVIGLLITFLVCRITIRRATNPLTLFADSANEVAKGHFDTPLPVITHKDEVRQLRDSFEQMQSSLSKYVDELQHTTAQKASIEKELKIAHDIQMSMLPKVFPPFPDRDDIDVYGLLMPAKAVGGDLFDFFIRDEKLFFCIGDVSGKGVPAALVMAVTRALFRTVSAHEAIPSKIVTEINEAMSSGNESNMFVTLFVGVLDLPTGRLRYCNAGHDAPLLFVESQDAVNSTQPAEDHTPSDHDAQLLAVTPNVPVGVKSGWKYSTQEIIIVPQTVVFLYTDGLTEAEDASHNQFGQKRVEEILAVCGQPQGDKPQEEEIPHVKRIIDSMTAAVHRFVNEAEQSDDLTMLAIQYTKQKLAVRLQRAITLANDVQEVPQLATFVDEVCEALELDMGTAMQLNLAIEEAVVNVMNYAYPPGTKGDVHIEAEANEARLKFVISDSGKPFDPTTKAEVDTTLSAEERGIGGLGIHLVRQIMDSINYERVKDQNVLTLRKKLK